MEREYPRDEFENDPARARSPEWDYGVHWSRDGADWPRWRVSWIIETGELYATPQGGAQRIVIVLAVLPKVGEYPYHDTHAWTAFKNAQTVELLMEGYAEQGKMDLSWLRDRLAAVKR